MKIMLAETVDKLEKLEQTNKSNRTSYNCKNCQSSSHDARTCPQPCKICKGNQGIHPFYKCLEYRPFKPQNIQLGQDTSKPTEHVLLEDDTFEQDYCLEDLFAHEDTIDSHSRKRVRIEDIDDEDEVRFVSIPKVAEESLKPQEKKKGIPKPKPKPVTNEPTAPHKAAKQLMNEAKISINFGANL